MSSSTLPETESRTGNAFMAIGVPSDIAVALETLNITEPTPIQKATLPDSLAGRDVLGRGRTGSGKTFAFLIPLVARLMQDGKHNRPYRPRALILAPTRELVGQIEESLKPLMVGTGLRSMTIYGGVNQRPQVRELSNGVDIALACPGRLEDLLNQGKCQLDETMVTILDEADHMADLGFLPGVKRILDLTPRDAQRLLFSATLDNGVNVLVKRYLTDPVTHEADSAQSPVSEMTHHVLHINSSDRAAIVTDLASAPGRTVIFTRTKHGAKKLAKQLNFQGVPTVEMHGNLAQNARVRNLEAFHSGKAAALVATDIAARGIHVDDVSLVVHADPPAEHKAYLHRSGRTARAGNSGTVVTLMNASQVGDVRSMTKAAGIKPTITKANRHSEILRTIAPGERSLPGALVIEAPANTGGGRGDGGRGDGGRGRSKRDAGGRGAGRGHDRARSRNGRFGDRDENREFTPYEESGSSGGRERSGGRSEGRRFGGRGRSDERGFGGRGRSEGRSFDRDNSGRSGGRSDNYGSGGRERSGGRSEERGYGNSSGRSEGRRFGGRGRSEGRSFDRDNSGRSGGRSDNYGNGGRERSGGRSEERGYGGRGHSEGRSFDRDNSGRSGGRSDNYGNGGRSENRASGRDRSEDRGFGGRSRSESRSFDRDNSGRSGGRSDNRGYGNGGRERSGGRSEDRGFGGRGRPGGRSDARGAGGRGAGGRDTGGRGGGYGRRDAAGRSGGQGRSGGRSGR